MTREEAKKMAMARLECMERETSGIQEMCNNKCDECSLNYEQGNMGEQKEWLRMAIKALEPCEDCISRDSAIKAMDYDIKSFEFKSGVSRYMDDIAKLLNTIYEIQVNNIKSLPPVTPQQRTGHWTPISERPPEESGTYTVTAYDGATKRVTYVKYLKRLKQWELTGSRAYWKVLAWMPLPKPYESQESEK